MSINVHVLCENCKTCREFEIEELDLFADGTAAEKEYCCKHHAICLNAVNVWERWNETE